MPLTSFNRRQYDQHQDSVFRHYRCHNTPNWRQREYDKQTKAPAILWGNEPWWANHYEIWHPHFIRVSETDAAMVAYTENNEKGERDIQTRVRPGRYLMKYFGPESKRKILTEKECAFYANWHLTGEREPTIWDSYELKFATTEQEIVRVYEHGPQSCMVRCFSPSNHLARAYASPDLAVAYLEGDPPANQRYKERTIVARAVIWPDKKLASRLYPSEANYQTDGFANQIDAKNCQNALTAKLKAEGYALPGEQPANAFRGARLKKIYNYRKVKETRNLLIPYLDGGYGVDVRPGEEFMVLT